ncbi:Replication protein A 70 kDa DNA-binding subunit, partial [Bienertia sinuspersici]
MDVKIKATLWGEKADMITNLIGQNDDVPQIVIITAAKVTMFNGKYQLNSTSGTKVYINLGTPEVVAFKECISHNAPQKLHQIQVDQPESLEEAMSKNYKTLRQLQKLYMDAKEDHATNEAYICIAKITKVLDQDCGWKYSSCNTCKSKLDHSQHCNKCNQTPLFPKNRYRIVVTIEDGDTTLNVGLFQDTKLTTHVKLPMKDGGPERVSAELQH